LLPVIRTRDMRRAVGHVWSLFGLTLPEPMPRSAPPVAFRTPGGVVYVLEGTRVRIVKLGDDESSELVGMTGTIHPPFEEVVEPGLEECYVAGVWLDHGLGVTQERRCNVMGDDVLEVLDGGEDGGFGDEDGDGGNRGEAEGVELAGSVDSEVAESADHADAVG
jgi:hypothetical protein